ncbi:SMI1/KNR4 family protein [Sinomicrobium sp. M5D2P9]
MRTIVAYNDTLDLKKWEDFRFDIIEIDTLHAMSDPEDFRNSFTFRDALLEAFENYSKKPVLKVLMLTPDYVFNFKYYGIAYLKSKEIVTVELKQTEVFRDWFRVIEKDRIEPAKVSAKLFHFGKNQYSMEPVSNYKSDLIFKDTGLFISKFIPNAFIAEELAKEKADFIAPYISFKIETDFTTVKEHFEKLVAANNLKVIPPADNEAVYAEFESESGFAFPEILKAFLTLHNGVENTAFMSAENIVKEWKDWQTIYTDWTQEELLDTYSENEGKTLTMYITPYWIPFFDLRNGNFIGLDFAPTEKGKPGQVIRFGADQEIGYQEAESLSAFLESLI